MNKLFFLPFHELVLLLLLHMGFCHCPSHPLSVKEEQRVSFLEISDVSGAPCPHPLQFPQFPSQLTGTPHQCWLLLLQFSTVLCLCPLRFFPDHHSTSLPNLPPSNYLQIRFYFCLDQNLFSWYSDTFYPWGRDPIHCSYIEWQEVVSEW